MQCYFYGVTRREKKSAQPGGVASFSIPDLGLSFSAQFDGNREECQYAGLLALLEFVELNSNLFRKKTLEIYGDSFIVVHQVNLKMVCTRNLEPYRNLALVYKKKISYTLNWIPPSQNRAQPGLALQA